MSCKPSISETIARLTEAVVALHDEVSRRSGDILTPQEAAARCRMGRDSGYRWLDRHGLIRRCPGEHMNRRTPHEFVIWAEVEAVLRQQPRGLAEIAPSVRPAERVTLNSILERAQKRRARP